MPNSGTDNLADNEQQSLVDWDGGPLSKQAWYNNLPTRCKRYRTLWERGYVLDRSVWITASSSHSYQLSIENVVESTFKDPNPLLRFKKIRPEVPDTDVPAAKASRFQDQPGTLEQYCTA